MRERPAWLRAAWLAVPLLFAAHPVLSFYQHNLGEVPFWEVSRWLLLALAGAAVVTLVLFAAIRRPEPASVLASLAVFGFFSYGHLFTALDRYVPSGGYHLLGVRLGEAKIIALLAAVVLAAVVTVLVRGGGRDAARITGVLGGALVVSSLVMIVAANAGAPSASARSDAGGGGIAPKGLRADPSKAVPAGQRPDIYYIVLDRYMGRRAVEQYTGYDNGPFLSELEDRGFFVADEAYSNYSLTYLSLGSTLNLDYIEAYTDVPKYENKPRPTLNSAQLREFYGLTRTNAVAGFLKQQGYRYVHVPSPWGVTDESTQADEVLDVTESREFSAVFLQTTAAGSFVEERQNAGRQERVLRTFPALDALRASKQPVFVFAHLAVPHEPYIFDAKGKDPGIEHADLKADLSLHEKLYGPQLRYTNELVLRYVDEWTKPRGRPVVVVIQGDHGGPYKVFRHKDTADDVIWRHHSVLNALYFSDGRPDALYEGISNVNTFRLIFDRYFGTDLGMLPDRSYNSRSVYQPHWPKDVTEQVRAHGPS